MADTTRTTWHQDLSIDQQLALNTAAVRLADELITKATQTAAKITFVEDPELLSAYGGVAAILRFNI